jgi:hypothetical protein
VKRKKGGREERKEKERSICESISSPNVNTLKKFYLVSMVSIDSHQLDLTENPFGCWMLSSHIFTNKWSKPFPRWCNFRDINFKNNSTFFLVWKFYKETLLANLTKCEYF